jgi:hypothetical protein
MALGRVFGPLLGGVLYASGSTGTLGLASASVMAAGGALLLYVDRQRFVVVRQFGTWQANRASVDTTQHA